MRAGIGIRRRFPMFPKTPEILMTAIMREPRLETPNSFEGRASQVTSLKVYLH